MTLQLKLKKWVRFAKMYLRSHPSSARWLQFGANPTWIRPGFPKTNPKPKSPHGIIDPPEARRGVTPVPQEFPALAPQTPNFPQSNPMILQLKLKKWVRFAKTHLTRGSHYRSGRLFGSATIRA
jgi:hypothetical protein